jgi:hypothetical protein
LFQPLFKNFFLLPFKFNFTKLPSPAPRSTFTIGIGVLAPIKLGCFFADFTTALGELTTGSFSEASRLSKGLRFLENEIDLEKNPAGRVSMEWEDEVEGASEVRCRIWKGMEERESEGKESGSCWGRVSGGFEGSLLDFEGLGLVLILDFLSETGRGGFGGGGGGGFGCLGGVEEM